jgi:hypothetical protein
MNDKDAEKLGGLAPHPLVEWAREALARLDDGHGHLYGLRICRGECDEDPEYLGTAPLQLAYRAALAATPTPAPEPGAEALTGEELHEIESELSEFARDMRDAEMGGMGAAAPEPSDELQRLDRLIARLAALRGAR